VKNKLGGMQRKAAMVYFKIQFQNVIKINSDEQRKPRDNLPSGREINPESPLNRQIVILYVSYMNKSAILA
jgi:hypothetical protein